jgi:hypothetical protein
MKNFIDTSPKLAVKKPSIINHDVAQAKYTQPRFDD